MLVAGGLVFILLVEHSACAHVLELVQICGGTHSVENTELCGVEMVSCTCVCVSVQLPPACPLEGVGPVSCPGEAGQFPCYENTYVWFVMSNCMPVKCNEPLHKCFVAQGLSCLSFLPHAVGTCHTQAVCSHCWNYLYVTVCTSGDMCLYMYIHVQWHVFYSVLAAHLLVWWAIGCGPSKWVSVYAVNNGVIASKPCHAFFWEKVCFRGYNS